MASLKKFGRAGFLFKFVILNSIVQWSLPFSHRHEVPGVHIIYSCRERRTFWSVTPNLRVLHFSNQPCSQTVFYSLPILPLNKYQSLFQTYCAVIMGPKNRLQEKMYRIKISHPCLLPCRTFWQCYCDCSKFRVCKLCFYKLHWLA